MKNTFQILTFLTLIVSSCANAGVLLTIPENAEQVSLKIYFVTPEKNETPAAGYFACSSINSGIKQTSLNSDSELFLKFDNAKLGYSCNYAADFGYRINSPIRNIKTFIKVAYTINEGQQVEYDTEIPPMTRMYSNGLEQWSTIYTGKHWY